MTPYLGVNVDIGGCFGKVDRIIGKTVTVKGVYHYPGGGAEPWTSFYHIDKFTPESWNTDRMLFDLSGVEVSFL